jgi:hypothetical protein
MDTSTNNPVRVRIGGVVHRRAAWGTTCGNVSIGLATEDDMDCMECIADLPSDYAKEADRMGRNMAKAFEKRLMAIGNTRAR